MLKIKPLITALFLGCCLSASLTSCLKDQDDLFDRPASARLQDRMDQVRQVLRSAEHGWEFDYYPGIDLSYGGVVYTVRFDSLTATVGCSLIPDSTETTYYRITNDNGPVLTFDTYNRLLHYFATPSASEYEAKGGEFEFVVRDVTDSLITLYGKKTRNTMYLRRLHASADDYATRTVSIFDHFVAGFTGTIDGNDVEGTFDLGNRSIKLTSATDAATTHFAFTDRGIRLYHPLRVAGTSIQALAYDTETMQFTAIDAPQHDIRLQGIPFADSVQTFSSYAGRYTLRYNNNRNIAVTLVPNRLDGTYLLSGLSRHYNLVLRYEPASGSLTLAPQVVGDYDGNTVYFCTYNSSVGSIWLAEEASFTLKWNGSKTRVVYNFTATNPNRYDCNSGVLIMVYYDESSNLTAALMTDNSWLPGGSATMPQLQSLQRQRD